MKINILRDVDGARQAEGIVVIIDVFRAFSTLYYIIANNAACVIPISEKDEKGYKAEKEQKEYVFIGEYWGNKLEGYDYSNSPSQVFKVDFSGKTILLRTSRGSEGLLSIEKSKAKEVIAGSFVGLNAICRHIIEHIKKCSIDTVTLVCMGNPDGRRAYEDEVCAECIRDMLLGIKVELDEIYQRIRNNPTSNRFFDDTRLDSPKEDFDLCMDFNRFNFVVRFDIDKRSLIRA